MAGTKRKKKQKSGVRKKSKKSKSSKNKAIGPSFVSMNQVQGELKFIDVEQANQNIAFSGTVASDFLTVPQGTTESERTGRKIWIKSIYIRGYLLLDNDAEAITNNNAGNDYVRVCIVRDKVANGSQATYAQVFGAATDNDLNSLKFRSLNRTKRFDILYEKWFRVGNLVAGYDGTAGTTYYRIGGRTLVEIYLNNLNIPISYGGATGAVSERLDHNVFMVMSDSNDQSDLGWSGLTRMRYVDG